MIKQNKKDMVICLKLLTGDGKCVNFMMLELTIQEFLLLYIHRSPGCVKP